MSEYETFLRQARAMSRQDLEREYANISDHAWRSVCEPCRRIELPPSMPPEAISEPLPHHPDGEQERLIVLSHALESIH